MKNKFVKACSMILVAAVSLGLCACGGKKEQGGNNSLFSGNKSDGNIADPSLAKQFVFSCKELDIPMDADDFSVVGTTRMNDRIYMMLEFYQWDDESSSQNDVKLISMKEDGSDIQTVELDFPASEEEDTTSSEESTDFNIDFSDEENEEYSEVYDGTYYGPYCITEDTIYGIKDHTFSDYTNPDNYIYEDTYSVCTWDVNGNFLQETPLEISNSEDEYLSVRQLTMLDDGTLIVYLSGDKSYKIEIGADGNASQMQLLTNASDKLANAADFLPKGNGEFLITFYDDAWEHLYFTTYNIQTDQVGETVELPYSILWSGYNFLTVGFSTDLIYADNSGLWGWNVGDEQATQIMSMVNSDMASTTFDKIIMLDDEHFVAFYYDDLNDYKTTGAFFTKRNPEDIPDKKVLVLAANYIDSGVRSEIVSFNKSNEDYRIVIKDYESFATEDDYMAGYTQLNNDIISGNMPDILVVSDALPIDNYISKGLLADIGALIEKDNELSKVEFMDNVFNAYKVNGKLYEVIPTFMVESYAGKKSILGDRTSWNFNDLKEVMNSMPEGATAFGDMTKESFLYTMMMFCGNKFVDVSTGKCNFDSQDFIDMLEYANIYPDDLNYDYDDDLFWDQYWSEYQSQYRDNRTLLSEVYMGSVRDMNYTINGYFGEDISFVGFPTETNKGSVVSTTGNVFALSAKSANLEGAWQFVRNYLTEDYQEQSNWGFPIVKSVFMEKAKEATQKNYYMDGDEKIEYDDYFDLNGESIVLEPLSQTQVDEIVKFIESIDTASYYNDAIEKIISEEAAGYFAGQKSAEEVAKIIQSRVQIYVDENR